MPVIAKNTRVRFRLPMNMKKDSTYSMYGELKASTLSFFVEYPPVEIQVNA